MPPLPTAAKETQCSIGKMAERIKVLADRPDDLSLIPENYTVEGENLPQQVVL